MRLILLLVLISFSALNVFAKVIIVADEVPAMEVVAGKLKSAEEIESTIVSQKELPSSLASYEAVVVYIHGPLAEGAENAFIDYTKAGGKLVLLHHSISSGKRKNLHWFSFLGVKLPEADLAHGGYKWIEGVGFELVALQPNHFIMTNKIVYPEQVVFTMNPVVAEGKGEGKNSALDLRRDTRLPGFRLEHTEVYLNHVHTEPRTLLMGLKYIDTRSGITYTHERAGWIKLTGKGLIVYLMPGHTKEDFENTIYGRIVVNAVIWKP
jgi:hypothetical protein